MNTKGDCHILSLMNTFLKGQFLFFFHYNGLYKGIVFFFAISFAICKIKLKIKNEKIIYRKP